MAELKPCPFCGGEADCSSVQFVFDEPKSPCYYRAFVKCTTCTARVVGEKTTKHYEVCSSREVAIAAWNRREPLECEDGCPLNVGKRYE